MARLGHSSTRAALIYQPWKIGDAVAKPVLVDSRPAHNAVVVVADR
jgi:hypothetical protein